MFELADEQPFLLYYRLFRHANVSFSTWLNRAFKDLSNDICYISVASKLTKLCSREGAELSDFLRFLKRKRGDFIRELAKTEKLENVNAYQRG